MSALHDQKHHLSSRTKRGTCSLLKLRQIARWLRGSNGAEIAEAALVLPLVFMLLLGIIWFGRAFNIYSTIQQAAQQGAIAAARASCATCGTGSTFPTDAVVTGVVEGVMNASKLDTTQIIANPPSPLSCVIPATAATCSTTDKITTCRQALLNSPASGTQVAQCGTIVSFQYPFQFNFPGTSLNMQQIKLSAQAQSRMEN